MYHINKTYLVHLLSFIFIIAFSNWTIAQVSDYEKLKELDKEFKKLVEEWNYFEKLKEKAKDHYIEYEYVVKKKDGKNYKEPRIKFVPKDEIHEKVEKMLENLEFARAEAYIKEYEDRTNSMIKSWDDRQNYIVDKNMELNAAKRRVLERSID
ncbi:MAG: hypothetical protein PVF17_08780, partial [Ignavibacteria bacterium]